MARRAFLGMIFQKQANLALDEKVKKQQMEMVKIQAVINDVKESVICISESIHEDVRISLNNTDAEVTTVKNSVRGKKNIASYNADGKN